jgi:hypothetical protein
MLVHSCCCIFSVVMSGFDCFYKKEFKSYLKMSLLKLENKKKREFSSP